jgi:hypothetical protein
LFFRLRNHAEKPVNHADLRRIREQYYTARQTDLPVPDRTYRTQLGTHLARVLETATKNNISENFLGRLKKWVRVGVMTGVSPDLNVS